MPGRAKANPKLTQKEEIALLKEDFLSYYRELPIKKAGADFIGRSIDTINNWEKDDPDFAERVIRAKAEYARKHGKGRPDNLLPKLYEEFSPVPVPVDVAHDVKDGSALSQLLAAAGFAPVAGSSDKRAG